MVRGQAPLHTGPYITTPMPLLPSPLNPLLATSPPDATLPEDARRALEAALGPVQLQPLLHSAPGLLRLLVTPSAGPGPQVLSCFDDPEAAARERWCLQHLAAAEFPYALRLRDQLAATWLLTTAPTAPTLAAAWPGLTPDHRRAALAAPGRTLRDLHPSFIGSRHGALDEHLGAPCLTWSALLTRELARLRHALDHLPRSPIAALADAALERLKHEIRHFHPRASATLVLRCVQPDRITLRFEGDTAEVEALLDLSCATMAPGEIDFGRLLWFTSIEGDDALIDAFYEGYGLARTMDVRRRERVYRALATLDWLAGFAQAPEALLLLPSAEDACARGLDLP